MKRDPRNPNPRLAPPPMSTSTQTRYQTPTEMATQTELDIPANPITSEHIDAIIAMRTVVEGIRYNSTSEVTLAPPTYHRYQYPRHLDPTNPTTYHAHNLNTAVLVNRVFIRPTPRVTTTLTDWKPTHNKLRNPNTPTTAPLIHSVDYSTRVHCNHCQTPFPSRNKLFHHLRTRNCSQN